jgi:hypothetical protein
VARQPPGARHWAHRAPILYRLDSEEEVLDKMPGKAILE